MWRDELESFPIELGEDTIFEALFKGPTEPQPKPRVHRKKHRSCHTSESGNEARTRKRKCTEMEQSMRASLIDEDMR